MKKTTTHREKGIALLFSVLITSMLLLVTLGIANISYKETIMAREATDSVIAFYAADTGIECALYLYKIGALEGSDEGPECNDIPLGSIESNHPLYDFNIDLGAARGCVNLKINRDYNSTDETEIRAYGYNKAGCGTPASPGLVVRAIRVQFPN